MLTQWFDPEPSFKGLLFAKALQERGHSVQVLTGFPNYPGGKVYPGYRIRPWKREIMDGIPVIRVALYPSHNRSASARALNYLSFALSASLLGTWLVKKVDVVYAYHAPPTIALPAILLRFLQGTPFLYDINDLWPDTLPATSMVRSTLVLRIVGSCCKLIYRLSAKIVVVSPGFKRRLEERCVPPEKITVISNWSHPIPPAEPDKLFEQQMAEKFVVLFAGNLGMAQGLDTILDAARLLQNMHPKVRFAIAGSGVDGDRMRQRAERESILNIVFLGRRPPEEMGGLYARADVLLVHLRDDPLFSITIPSKSLTYLAAGKPILMAACGDAADLVAQAGAGLVVAPQNPSQMAKAVEEMLSMPRMKREAMGLSGRRFYDENLSLDKGVTAFENLMKQVCLSRIAASKRRILKEAIDLVLVAVAIPLWLPVFWILSLLIKLLIGSPMFFRQTRPGKNGMPFELLKFRTMTEKRDPNGVLLPDSQRLTPFGRWLRATSLDELPELWNVLKGDMSLVGPRPLLMEYLPLYSSEQARRHEVRPGITGWAQVNGRNTLTWDEKFKLDVWYVDNRCFLLDVKILLLTALTVFRRDGISASGHATMPVFKGNQPKDINVNS